MPGSALRPSVRGRKYGSSGSMVDAGNAPRERHEQPAPSRATRRAIRHSPLPSTSTAPRSKPRAAYRRRPRRVPTPTERPVVLAPDGTPTGSLSPSPTQTLVPATGSRNRVVYDREPRCAVDLTRSISFRAARATQTVVGGEVQRTTDARRWNRFEPASTTPRRRGIRLGPSRLVILVLVDEPLPRHDGCFNLVRARTRRTSRKVEA